MGLGALQPLHLLILVLIPLILFGVFIGTAMFLIRYAVRQRYAAEQKQRTQE